MELGLALIFAFCAHIQTLMSATVTMEVATTTAMTQMEVTHVPAIMATYLTVMDTLVKVSKVDEYNFNELYVLNTCTTLGYGILKSALQIQ